MLEMCVHISSSAAWIFLIFKKNIWVLAYINVSALFCVYEGSGFFLILKGDLSAIFSR